MTQSTVIRILRTQVVILSATNSGYGDDFKTIRTLRFPDVDRIVLEWFRRCESQHVSLSGPIIRRQAEHVAERLKVGNFLPAKDG